MLKICWTHELNQNYTSDIWKGAVTLLRQQIEEKWSEKDKVLESDKQLIRDNIIECITKSTDFSVIQSLEDCTRNLVLKYSKKVLCNYVGYLVTESI